MLMKRLTGSWRDGRRLVEVVESLGSRWTPHLQTENRRIRIRMQERQLLAIFICTIDYWMLDRLTHVIRSRGLDEACWNSCCGRLEHQHMLQGKGIGIGIGDSRLLTGRYRGGFDFDIFPIPHYPNQLRTWGGAGARG